jgi:hypothetical protein
MRSFADNAKFHLPFLATALSFAMRFRQKRRVIKTFEYLGELKKYL